MGISIEVIKRRIVNTIYALGYIGVILLLSAALEYWGKFVG
jgi:hypothetical protein